MDSSVEKVGPEDCRNIGVIGHEIQYCSSSMKNCRRTLISLHMEMLKFTIEDRRKLLLSLKSNMCQIDRSHNVVCFDRP